MNMITYQLVNSSSWSTWNASMWKTERLHGFVEPGTILLNPVNWISHWNNVYGSLFFRKKRMQKVTLTRMKKTGRAR